MSARSTTCSRRCCPAGFYYKTFMWPRAGLGARCTSRCIRRAAGLGPRAATRPTPTATRSATRIATCWSSAPARPGLPPRCRGGDAGARVILCDEQAEFGGSLLAERRRRDRRRAAARLGRRTRVAALAAPAATCTLLPRTTAFGYYAAQPASALGERLTDHLAGRRPRCRASGCGRCARREVVLATGAHRAAARVPRQRPARRHAGRRRAHLPATATACAPARARSSSTANDAAYRAALDLQRGGRRDRR